MKQKKLNLANIQGKLSRAEMKKIMAGSDAIGCVPSPGTCDVGNSCLLSNNQPGRCYQNSSGTSCYCGGGS